MVTIAGHPPLSALDSYPAQREQCQFGLANGQFGLVESAGDKLRGWTRVYAVWGQGGNTWVVGVHALSEPLHVCLKWPVSYT